MIHNVHIVLRKSKVYDADYHVCYVTWDRARAEGFKDKVIEEGCAAYIHTATLGDPLRRDPLEKGGG